MNLYPAIDLYEGRVVRLTRGDFARCKIYSEYPGKQAAEFEAQGAPWLHVVDLEGAKLGCLKNLPSLKKIREAVSCPIQFGGGIRSLEDIGRLIDLGVNRVILGTRALEKHFFFSAIERFANGIAVGLDVRDGRLQTDGWLKESGESLSSVLLRFRDYPLGTIIYTDIQRDGMLEGPNFDGLEEVLAAARSRVIFSGGVSSLGDIERCLTLVSRGLDGVIIGKALYEQKIALKDVMGVINTSRKGDPYG